MMMDKRKMKRTAALMTKRKDVIQAGYDNRTWKATIHQSVNGKVAEPFEIESEGVWKIIHKWKDDENIDGEKQQRVSSTVFMVNSAFPEAIEIPCNIDEITYPDSKYEASETYQDQKRFFFLLFMVFAVMADIQLHMTGFGSEETTLATFLNIFSDPIVSAGIVGAAVTLLSVIKFTKGDLSLVRFDITRQLEDPGNISKVGGVYMPSGYDVREQMALVGAMDPMELDKKLIDYHAAVLRFNMDMMQSIFVDAQQSRVEGSESAQRFRQAAYMPPEMREQQTKREQRFWDTITFGIICGTILISLFLYFYYVGGR